MKAGLSKLEPAPLMSIWAWAVETTGDFCEQAARKNVAHRVKRLIFLIVIFIWFGFERYFRAGSTHSTCKPFCLSPIENFRSRKNAKTCVSRTCDGIITIVLQTRNAV